MSIELTKAVATHTQVVDWERLGEYLADQDSNDQAYLLVGFWAAVSDSQLDFIAASGVFGKHVNSTRAEVAEFYRALADKIEAGGVR